ncbi:electron transfer flavoprotein subunit alpha/FixB family protein [Weeksellaceae bacterium TAE3-ERU29]|nr:electron transfer flavoprotein subunit alpha/FixB family protein [Weeksellaceae bacterium TAE3-ERU29]
MSILVYTETHEGKFRKNAYEVVSYANLFEDEVIAVALNSENPEELFKYGANKVLNYKTDRNITQDLVAQVLSAQNADTIILSHSNEGATIAPFVAIDNAALITNITAKPESFSPFKVERKAFSGKGIMTVETDAAQKVLTISPNSYGAKEKEVEGQVELLQFDLTDEKVKIEAVEINYGKQDLKEADIVVGAGRGLKAAENWGIIEDLADSLNAATACSKPVSDMGWRPHSEHVGQTGKVIAPKLYVAVGISGAIQHLAGLNASKNILVINTDAEAPFFKSANYGIVGDAFEVVPKLTEAIKKLNS